MNGIYSSYYNTTPLIVIHTCLHLSIKLHMGCDLSSTAHLYCTHVDRYLFVLYQCNNTQLAYKQGISCCIKSPYKVQPFTKSISIVVQQILIANCTCIHVHVVLLNYMCMYVTMYDNSTCIIILITYTCSTTKLHVHVVLLNYMYMYVYVLTHVHVYC